MSLGKDYIFKSQTKKQLLILFASGILLTIVGIFMIINGDSHHEEVSNLVFLSNLQILMISLSDKTTSLNCLM